MTFITLTEEDQMDGKHTAVLIPLESIQEVAETTNGKTVVTYAVRSVVVVEQFGAVVRTIKQAGVKVL